MRRNWWTKNLGVRAGAAAVAGLATLGFYGLVAANPPHHAASAGAADTSDENGAPVNPTPISVRPGLPGGASGQPSGGSPSGSTRGASGSVAPVGSSGGSVAPIVQPHTRTRGS
jgi:hypothetical protein